MCDVGATASCSESCDIPAGPESILEPKDASCSSLEVLDLSSADVILVGDVPQVEPCRPTTISGTAKTSTGKRKRQREGYDEINEMHLHVLKKESIKLDMEIENLKLMKRKIELEIEKLEKSL